MSVRGQHGDISQSVREVSSCLWMFYLFFCDEPGKRNDICLDSFCSYTCVVAITGGSHVGSAPHDDLKLCGYRCLSCDSASDLHVAVCLFGSSPTEVVAQEQKALLEEKAGTDRKSSQCQWSARKWQLAKRQGRGGSSGSRSAFELPFNSKATREEPLRSQTQ